MENNTPDKIACSTCRRVLPSDCFYNNRARSTGKSASCKTCDNEYTRMYRDRRPDILRKAILSWKYRNIEKVREQGREYARRMRARDPEKYRTRDREYYRKRKNQLKQAV